MRAWGKARSTTGRDGQYRRLEGEFLFRGGDQLAVVEFENTVGEVKITVVMRDHEDGLAAVAQLGEQLAIEDFLEVRVLVGRPLIKDIEWTVLQVGGQQREAFALALRQRGGGQAAVDNLDLVAQVQLPVLADEVTKLFWKVSFYLACQYPTI